MTKTDVKNDSTIISKFLIFAKGFIALNLFVFLYDKSKDEPSIFLLPPLRQIFKVPALRHVINDTFISFGQCLTSAQIFMSLLEAVQ